LLPARQDSAATCTSLPTECATVARERGRFVKGESNGGHEERWFVQKQQRDRVP
jgi:hypothetical protein